MEIGARSGVELARAVISEAEEIPGIGLNDGRGVAQDLKGFIENGNRGGGFAALDEALAFAQIARPGRAATGQGDNQEDGESQPTVLFYRQHGRAW